MAGVWFMFYPDFSNITINVVLSALGQAFFSMSLGLGAIITYGSYARDQDNAMKSSLSVAVIGIVVAILAGLVIFPAVFSFGIPAQEGANLAYVTFPAIFQQMPGGYFFGIVFFILLLVAAMTSIISIFEVIVAYLSEEFKVKRGVAILLIALSVCITSTVCGYSLVEDTSLMIGGKNIFTVFDHISASYLLPLGGLFISIFVGWVWGKDNMKKELSSNGLYKVGYFPYYMFVVKYIIPVFIFFIFLSQIGIFK